MISAHLQITPKMFLIKNNKKRKFCPVKMLLTDDVAKKGKNY